MPRGDKHYVVEWRNPAIDEHAHFMVISCDLDDNVLRHVRNLQGHNPAMQIDEKQPLKQYRTKADAHAEADRRSAEADAAHPDRIGVDRLYPPGEANRALDVGSPLSTPAASTGG